MSGKAIYIALETTVVILKSFIAGVLKYKASLNI